ncbi:MAG: glycosyltransferase [Desulfobacteraceae bacterium]|nr:glycosyltransferase [Desulfobacteraceae bacterium]
MAKNHTFNILMYSHDTYGLGHIRRTMAIASYLRGPNINVLILTGSPIAGRFSFPEKVDFVRIPGMIKKTNEEYKPLSIKINPQHALDIRKNIITATAKAFQPHLFIVDKEPLGLKKEVLPTLQWIRRSGTKTRAILGLRDIMDDAETVKKDWSEKGVYRILEDYYSEIWVYGNRELYDPIREYGISDAVQRKMHFTGYISRKVPDRRGIQQVRREQGLRDHEKLVVVTTGGGGDGFAIVDTYLTMIENLSAKTAKLPFKSVLITGPFMPKHQRKQLFRRARKLGIRTFHFFRQMEKIMAAADLVICMGGYNTICEILSLGVVSLVIPRETPRLEQLLRARALRKENLVDYIPWHELNAAGLNQKVFELLEHPEHIRQAVSQFQLTGIEAICDRIADISSNTTRCASPTNLHP